MGDRTLTITDELKKEFEEEGFFILEKVISDEDLEFLRNKCDELVKAQIEEMEETGKKSLDLSLKGSRYWVHLPSKEHTELKKFIFSDIFAEICKATLGENAILFWEQFVVKGPKQPKSEFAWHQDSGYVDFPHKTYINTWTALDDVSDENGTMWMLPYSEVGSSEKVEHKNVGDSPERAGYFGDKKGIEIKVPAGSIVVFSSTCFHRSGPNKSDSVRRAYSLQWAQETIYDEKGEMHGHSEPFLVDGKKVAEV